MTFWFVNDKLKQGVGCLDFKCSEAGGQCKVCNGKKRNEISDHGANLMFFTWKEEVQFPKIQEYSIGLEDLYNEDQTELYRHKLPKGVYADKVTPTHGVKQMKDKTRSSLMGVTIASAARGPLCLVGASKCSMQHVR